MELAMNDFDSDDFSIETWIDDACRRRPTGEPLDKYVAQLEMQLQLSCEETENEIETAAAKVAAQIPYVLQEATGIEGEMSKMKASMGTLAGRLKDRAVQAQENVKGIRELHQIKVNMQSACDSLKEATELSELFVRVDAVFGSGDIFAMAKMITTMQRSLKLVGDVPEFRSRKEKLKVLEENLITSIETRLATAISEKQDDHSRKLSEILTDLNRHASIERTYISIKKKEKQPWFSEAVDRLKAAAQTTGIKGVEDCVREWHEGLLLFLNAEMEWCSDVFPDNAMLPVRLLLAMLTDWNRELDDVLRGPEAIHLAISIQSCTNEFCLVLKRLLESLIEADVLQSVIDSTTQPTETVVNHFATLEQQILIETIKYFSDPYISLTAMTPSIETIFHLMEQSIEDCTALTGGTEMLQLVKELEFSLSKYISEMTASLKAIRSELLSEASSQDTTDVTSILRLLKIGMTMEQHLHGLKEQLIIAVSNIHQVLNKEISSIDSIHLRLQRSPEKKRQLVAFLEEGDWKGYPIVRQSIDGFKATAEALVFDVLMEAPRSLFKGFAEMEEWRKQEVAASVQLPQFSSYPLRYVSSLGECLMLIPQQLESLVSTEDDIDPSQLTREEEMASALLAKVIVGCAELYADEVLTLTKLSVSGTAQLLCDIQYFFNVLSAMSAQLPPPLSTVYEAVQLPIDQLKTASTQDANKRFIFAAILRMREGGMG